MLWWVIIIGRVSTYKLILALTYLFYSIFLNYTCIGVNEWLLFNANSAIFQLYHGENKLIINEKTVKNERDPSLFTSKQLIKF